MPLPRIFILFFDLEMAHFGAIFIAVSNLFVIINTFKSQSSQPTVSE